MSNRIVPTSDRTIHWTATVEGGSFVASGVTVVADMPVDVQPTKTPLPRPPHMDCPPHEKHRAPAHFCLVTAAHHRAGSSPRVHSCSRS